VGDALGPGRSTSPGPFELGEADELVTEPVNAKTWGIIMRKLLHATAALSALLVTSMTANAADVYARPRPYVPPPAPVYAPPPLSWTGFYIGGNVGGAWAHRDVTDSFFGINFNNGNNNGVFIGGGQVGYNWQFGYGVVGVEADFDGVASNNNTGTVFTAVGPIPGDFL
jgi:outer membrane immunogenic protein